MKEKIIEKASQLFLSYGFKSVTMDDLASKMGISKKTIYKYFENKEILIAVCVDFVHQEIHTKMQSIFDLNKNAIEENFIIRKMFNSIFKSEGDSPLFQLKKHYPIIYEKVRERESIACKEAFIANIKKGIAEGHYKNNINIEESALFYYLLIFGINETIPLEREVSKLELSALLYHISSIATPAGIKELEKQINQYNTHEA